MGGGGTDGESTRANSRAKWVVCSPDSAPYGLATPYTARQHKHTYTQHVYTQTHTACIHTQIPKYSSTQTIAFTRSACSHVALYPHIYRVRSEGDATGCHPLSPLYYGASLHHLKPDIYYKIRLLCCRDANFRKL